MSIKRKYLDSLKKQFIYESELFKKSQKRAHEVCDKMIELIIHDSLKDISEDELKVLNKFKNFWKDTYLYFGWSFRRRFGGVLEIEYSNKSFILDNYYRNFRVPVSSLDRTLNLVISDNAVKELITLNDEILLLESEMSKVISTWDRLINRNTSKRWLKRNFPEIYEELRKL